MKLHLGCSNRYIPGFVHIDAVHHEHVDYVGDVSNLWMIEDGTCELVYASHVLQYFDQHQALDVLKEWRRVLKPGGICRLSVPNFAVLAKAHEFGLGMEWLLGSLYGRMEGPNGTLIFHKCCYDEAYLRKTFNNAGFINGVRHWDWRTTEHAETDDFSQGYFPHMAKNVGVQWNLNMEGIK